MAHRDHHRDVRELSLESLDERLEAVEKRFEDRDVLNSAIVKTLGVLVALSGVGSFILLVAGR